MRILLDTCVLSELRRPSGNPAVTQAVQSERDQDLFVSVISIGEFAKGIALLSSSKKKRDLISWAQSLEQLFADRILPIDVDTCHLWGELTATAQKSGKIIPASDGLIAATAIRHGLYVMTRNTEHFVPTGVLITNPWQQ